MGTRCRMYAYHDNDVIMGAIESQITSLTIVYSFVYSDADQRIIKAPRHWLLCVGNSPHKWPVTRKMFPFDDVIMGGYMDKQLGNINIIMHHFDSITLNLNCTVYLFKTVSCTYRCYQYNFHTRFLACCAYNDVTHDLSFPCVGVDPHARTSSRVDGLP